MMSNSRPGLGAQRRRSSGCGCDLGGADVGVLRIVRVVNFQPSQFIGSEHSLVWDGDGIACEG
jgi:hypothetical protein